MRLVQLGSIKWLLVAVLLAPLLLYWPTIQSMAHIWNTSDTYAHGYFILPVSLWLIWQQRVLLQQLPLRPCWPVFGLLLLLGFAWLLAELAEVQVVAQYAFVCSLPLLVMSLFGWRFAWAIAFPLAFLILAVPFGEALIPILIEFTADFIELGLTIVGLPMERDGHHFVLPTGSWVVVEECSGLRYLIASMTLGTIYAYLTYRSFWRQSLCVLLSIVVPIIANGLRALMIVLIGHYSGMTLAVGVDHLIYGWLFFGVVMLLFFWVGSFWREDHEPVTASATRSFTESSGVSNATLIAASLLSLLLLAVWPIYASYLQQHKAKLPAVQLSAIESGWQNTAAFTDWSPDFLKPAAISQQWLQQQGTSVALFRYFYRNQQRDSKLISSSNLLIGNARGEWRQKPQQNVVVADVVVRESLLQRDGEQLLVWQWYWVDGQVTHSDYHGKLLQAKSMLLRQRDDGVHLLLLTPVTSDVAAARQQLMQFWRQHAKPLQQQLTQVSGGL